MSWIAVGVGAATLIGGAISSNQQNKAAQGAANSQMQMEMLKIQAQQQADAQRRADMMPFLQAGYGALGRQEAVLNGDFSGFQNSPDYKFNFDQGMQAMDRSAAARGGLYSGGHSADLMRFGQGLASTHLNDYWAKLAGQAGQGYQGVSQLGQMGQMSAQNMGNAFSNMGNARASSYLQRGQNNADFATGTMGTLANLYGSYMANRPARTN